MTGSVLAVQGARTPYLLRILALFSVILPGIVILGCQGGGGGADGGSGFDQAAYDRMKKVADEVTGDYIARLNGGADAEVAATGACELARAKAGVTRALPASDGTAVWLAFDTGVMHVITQLPPVTSQPTLLTAQPSPSRGRDPTSEAGNKRAIDLNGAWPGWTDADNSSIREMLHARGYECEELRGGEVTVEAFRSLTPYSVVYIDTHGPTLDVAKTYGPVFLTREEVTEWKDLNAYRALLALRYMCEATIIGDKPPYRDLGHFYGVCDGYIRGSEGRFPTYSLVLTHACSSLAGPRMANAFRGLGVSAYAGWDAPGYDPGMANSTVMLFDFLTGANRYPVKNSYPSVGKQRLAMNLGNAVNAVKQEGLGTVDTVGANLQLAFGDAYEFSFATMPHLDAATVSGSRLLLKGTGFGAGAGKVIFTESQTATPVEMTPSKWSDSDIECVVPAAVAGQRGDVIVQDSRGLGSNPLRVAFLPSLAYLLYQRTPQVPDATLQLVVDGRTIIDDLPFNGFEGTSLAFSGDGQYLALAGCFDPRTRITILSASDGELQAPVDLKEGTSATDLAFGGNRLAYLRRATDPPPVVVVDGRPASAEIPYDAMHQNRLALSGDGQHLAVSYGLRPYETPGIMFISANSGLEEGTRLALPYDAYEVADLKYGGNRLAYLVRGKEPAAALKLMVDGVKIAEVPPASYWWLDCLAFSGDGRHIAVNWPETADTPPSIVIISADNGIEEARVELPSDADAVAVDIAFGGGVP